MAYDRLTRRWRIAYGACGAFLLLVGGFGAVGEVRLARQGYALAWPFAALTACLAALGAYLVYAVVRGRIRTLGVGRRPPAV